MTKYIIGIDGGGTKTLGVLFDVDGREIKRVELGYSNFRVNKDIARRNLEQTIDALIQNVSIDDVDFIQIGVAGVPEEEYKQEVIDDLQTIYKTPVSIVTDAEIALYSIKQDSDDCVIMVIGGTGSAIMVKEDNQDLLIGGFGHLLGDEGSGYHLSITALRNIIQQYEEGKQITPLSKAVLQEIKATNYYEIKDFVYNSSKQEIAELSRFISQYATNGDNEAIALFKEEGKHLARQTLTAFKKIKGCKTVTIGIKGGFLLHAPYVKETFVEELDKNQVTYHIDENPKEPVYGAYYLGLKYISKG